VALFYIAGLICLTISGAGVSLDSLLSQNRFILIPEPPLRRLVWLSPKVDKLAALRSYRPKRSAISQDWRVFCSTGSRQARLETTS
jgi:hypothetical protein